MNQYHHLTVLERETLAYSLLQRKSFGAIAKAMGRHKSTLSREVLNAKAQKGTYRALTGQYYAKQRKVVPKKPKKIETNEQLRVYIHDHLRLEWSPQEIAERLKREYPDEPSMHVSHETIYTYLYVLPRGELKKELLACLRQDRTKRKRRKNTHEKRGQITNMLSIDERPEEVADRTIPGHWEGDLIVGKGNKSALGTLVERTTRATILVPLTARDATTVRKAFARETKSLPKQMKLTLTYDRGKEMAEHELFTKQTKIQVYFAHPQSPWERGTNENTNGLVRQYFPKGTDFTTVSRRYIKQVQDRLNGRPRKALDYQMPIEVFNDLLQ